MARDRDQESSEVRNLILRTLEQEQEAQLEQQSTDSESDQEDLNGTYDVNREDDPNLMRVRALIRLNRAVFDVFKGCTKQTFGRNIKPSLRK